MFKKKSIIGIVLVGIIALVVGLGSMSLADTSDENSRSTLPEDQEWMLVALGDKDNPQDDVPPKNWSKSNVRLGLILKGVFKWVREDTHQNRLSASYER